MQRTLILSMLCLAGTVAAQGERLDLQDDVPLDTYLALLAQVAPPARDGAEALDYLYEKGSFKGRNQGEPAVVLLDLKLPKVDGLEVVRAIKAHPTLRVIPVVMLTTSSVTPDVKAAYMNGANSYIVKPVDFDKFQEVATQIELYWAVMNTPAE